jgi:hypothetical protein
VLELVVTVRVADEPVVELGLTLALAPDGTPVTAPNVTDPLQLERVIETVDVVVPWASVCVDGLTDIVKFAAFWFTTANVSVVEWVRAPLVPVTVGLYVPAVGCPPPIVRLAVRVPEPLGTVTDAPDVVVPPTLQLAEVPFGRLPAVSVTAPLKPFDGTIDTT